MDILPGGTHQDRIHPLGMIHEFESKYSLAEPVQ